MPLVMRQLADLILGSVPTIILFLLVILVYWLLVYRPLTRVLAERRERTEGLAEQARLVLASAEATAREYEARIREARLEVFRDREERLQRWDREREKTMLSVTEAAAHKIGEARSSLEREAADARGAIQAGAVELARDIVAAILPRSVGRNLAASRSGD